MKGTRGVLWIGRCGTRGRSPLHKLDASSSVCLSKLCPHWAWPQAQSSSQGFAAAQAERYACTICG